MLPMRELGERIPILVYVTVENPAFFPEQSYIVDSAGRVVGGN
jgi:hypothetical protein